MKKIKPPLFSPTQLAITANESIGLTTLGEAIARNIWEHIFNSPLDLDDYTRLLEAVRAVTNDPALQAELETRWTNKNSQQDEKINILQHHVRYACLYLELARAAEAHKDRERAWAFTNYASLMVGEIIEKSAAVLDAMEADKRSDKNSKNAQGRNKSILLVKREAARLLEEKRPEDGWRTKVKAVYHLEDPLAEFIERNNIPALKITNIEKWLTAWLREDVLVNQAWEKTKHAKAR